MQRARTIAHQARQGCRRTHLPTSTAHSSTRAPARAYQSRAYEHSARPAASSSSSSSTYLALTLGMLATGSAMVASTIHAESAPDAAAAAPSRSRSKVPSTARNVTDLGSIDYRTLGVCACPPLPSHAPAWLREQARDPSFQYRDLAAILDITDHLMYDGLGGDRRLSEVYYFCEKVDSSKPEDDVATGTHAHPHLPPSLDFEPQTPAGKQPHQQQKQSASWASSITSYLSSWFRSPSTASSPPSSSSSSSPAAASPAPGVKAFSHFTPEVVHMTATGPEVRAIFHVGRALCGHKGIVHGGMTAALMDEVSGAATFCAAGGGNFTANLNINYLKPIRAAQYLLIRAQAVKQEGRKTYVNISVEDGVGGVFARGTALYVKPKMLPPAVMVAATQ